MKIEQAILLSSACLSLLITGGSARAEESEFIRNGHACLKELCIGDGLDVLAKVKWMTAVSPSSGRENKSVRDRKVGRGDVSRVARRYKGETAGIVSYLADDRFDGESISGLRKVTAACETHALQGNFVTESGNPTLVLISLTPDVGNPAIQKWQVRRITRKIPSVVTSEQQAETKGVLESRYFPFTLRERTKSPVPIDMFQTGNSSGFSFTLSSASVLNESQMLKQHPSCGGIGAGKVNID